MKSNEVISKRRLSRHWIATGVSCALLGIVILGSPNWGGHRSGGETPMGGDFLQEWVGAYTIAEHGPRALFDLELVREIQHDPELLGFEWPRESYFAMVYPPFYYLGFVPAAQISYKLAAWMFVITMIACFFAAHWLLGKCVGPEMDQGLEATRQGAMVTRLPWLLIGSTMFVPVIRSITTGQKGTACLLILVATYWLLSQRKPFTAGAVFGLLAFKPQLALVIGLAMLIRRQWSFVAGAAMIVLISVGICIGLGFDVCAAYAEFCLGVGTYQQIGGYDLHKSHCLLGFFTLLAGGQSNLSVKLLWLASAAGIALLLGRMYRLNSTQKPCVKLPVEFSALVLATLLLTPHLFTYDLTILLLPMYLLTSLVVQQVLGGRQQKQVVFAMVALFVVAGFSHNLAQSIGVQITTPIMLLMLWGISWYPIGSGKASQAITSAFPASTATG